MEMIFYGQLYSESGGYGAQKRDISCGWRCTAPWRQLSASLEMAPLTAFGAFLITAITTFKWGATKRNFIVRLTTFNLLDLRLILDCELLIRKF